MKVTYFFGIFFVFAFSTQAQQLDWLALSDAAANASIRHTEIDAEGNVFLMGSYSGEIMLKSATEQGKSFHGHANKGYSRSFITKYDRDGNMLFTIRLYKLKAKALNSGIEIQASTLLSNGNLVVAAYSMVSNIVIEDAEEKTHFAKRSSQYAFLLYFSNTGQFIKSIELPLQQVQSIQEDANGRLYVMHRSSKAGSFHLYYLEKGTKAFQEIAFSKKNNIEDFTIKDAKVWLLTSKKGGLRYLYELSLSTWSGKAKDSVESQFTVSFGDAAAELPFGFKAKLLPEGKRMEVVINMYEVFKQTEHKQKVIMSNGPTVYFNGNGFILLKEDGSFKKSLNMGKQEGNVGWLQRSSNGNYYVTLAPVQDILLPNYPRIQAKKYSKNIAERVLIKFNQQLAPVWSTHLGATSDSYPSYGVEIYQDKLLYAASLARDSQLLGKEYKLNWRSGLFLLQISDK